MLLRAEQSYKLDKANLQPRKKPLLSGPSAKIIRPAVTSVKKFRAIPHNSKCRYGERGAADAKPKAQIILDAAKVSAASGGNSEPKQGQRSQSARGFCPRSTMRVPQPDIIEHFGNADAVPQLPERCLSRQAGIVRCCLKTFGACGNTFLPTYWSQAHRVRLPGVTRREPALRPAVLPSAQ